MRDHKVWNSDVGRIFIEGYDKIEKSYCPHCHKDKKDCKCGELAFKDQSAIEAEKEKLGKGGQAIDKMLNGPINKEFDAMVKAEPSEIIAANTQVNDLYRKIKTLRTKLSSDPGVKSELDKLTTQHNAAVQKRDKLVGFTKTNE